MKSKKVYGLDFGTTNSAVAISQEGEVRVLPLALNGDKMVRSLLFFPRTGRAHFTGEDAITHYIESGMEGRLIQSVKTFLPDKSFTGTALRGRNHTLEDLIALILKHLKTKADEITGEDIRSVVLGRPARFSVDPGIDDLAEKRLLRAAQLAGFEEIRFQFEPIAAAYSYESRLSEAQLVLVADLGGGTSDFAIVRLGPQKKAVHDRSADILGTQGVYVGGDKFNSEIMSHRLLKYFGSDLRYKSFDRMLQMPPDLMRVICEWHKIPSLKGREDRDFVARLCKLADDKEAAARLYALIEEDLGFMLFQAIEKAKQDLSINEFSTVSFCESVIEITEAIARPAFEQMISKEMQLVERCVDQLVRDAGVTIADVDSVFLTGGTSYVPRVRRFFVNLFGEKKIKPGDAFISVAEGLALSSHIFSW
ncbi:MAG: Hsp70 family protein [bacterium]|nr:Hsp70 family protein [bacterium]